MVLGAVYGHALQPLFFTARGLVEMLETMEVGDGSGDVVDVPCVASLHFTKSLDDCNSVGMACCFSLPTPSSSLSLSPPGVTSTVAVSAHGSESVQRRGTHCLLQAAQAQSHDSVVFL